jgi:hypothetical protein
MPSNDSAGSTTLDVQAIGPGRWAAELARPDAAVLIGLGISAVLDELGERRLVAVTTHFVAPATTGRVEITVGHIDRTAARTTTDARIRQSDHVIARLLLTTTTGPDPDRQRSAAHWKE